MKLLMTDDKASFDAFTRIAAHRSVQVMELIRGKLGKLMGEGRETARQAVVRYLEYLQWPVRQMEYSFVLHALNRYSSGSKASSILDVGSGPSPFPPMLAEAFKSEVISVDTDEGMMEFMRRLGLPGCSFAAADMRSLPFGDRSFDAVCCVSVLEHVGREDGIQAVSEMLRVVKERGIVVLTVDYRSLGYAWGILKALSRLRSAAALLLSGGAASIIKAAAAPGPYTWSDLSSLCARFKDSLVGEPDRSMARLSLGRIRDFWRDHWRDGFHYDGRIGSDYTSVGMILSPQPETVRHVLEDER
jgi:SAM-dependent methyltransferase